MKARVGTAKEEFENAQLRFDVARTSGKSGKNAITTTVCTPLLFSCLRILEERKD